MDDYLNTHLDSGGVHTNSSIHNKAAYNVLTRQADGGSHVFTSREVAVLYYLSLVRLNSLSNFSEALGVLLDVASVYFAGDADRDAKLQHIREAYRQVGIE